jgi:hypothetical protein
VVTFNQVARPTDTDGQHAPALRFGDPRVMAVMAAVVGFTHVVAGFDNRQITELVATLLDAPYTSRQATYDLRRLRRKRLIARIAGTHRYHLTPLGRLGSVTDDPAVDPLAEVGDGGGRQQRARARHAHVRRSRQGFLPDVWAGEFLGSQLPLVANTTDLRSADRLAGGEQGPVGGGGDEENHQVGDFR